MIRNWLQKFMMGRYGPDHLNVALMILVLVIYFVNIFVGEVWLDMFAYAVMLLALFRMMSRKVAKRRRENDRFLRFWWPVRQKIKGFFARMKDRKHYRFFKCPACRKMLRVPKGKGKILITCPKCGERFQKKT